MGRYRLMVDSGAFSVWSKGATIDLDAYIRFCHDHPDVRYYVGLDVIPGKMFQKRTVTTEGTEASCKASWDNYQEMLRQGLPKAKVIPVYHQNDDLRWLKRYLEFGTPYVGISPANDSTTEGKLRYLDTVKPYIFNRDGSLAVRTHGFAVTSYRLMKYMDWWSVDSASWKLSAAWGGIYFPVTHHGRDDYSKPPLLVGVSPMSPTVQKRQQHVDSMSPRVKARLLDYLAAAGVSLGRQKIVQESAGYRLDREDGETWYDKSRHLVLKVMERGVANNLNDRLLVNARYVRKANKVLPVRHIYFAGAPVPDERVERALRNRLLSFHEMKGASCLRCLAFHEQLRTQPT